MYLTVVFDFVMGVSPMIELNPFVEKTHEVDFTKNEVKAVA